MISSRCMITTLFISVGVLFVATTMDAFTIPTPPTVPVFTVSTTAVPSIQYHHQPLNTGIRSFVDEANVVSTNIDSSSSSSSTMMVSLQERKIPTKEEIDQKKFNFNVIFWGGGFVAPFIATVFYFGFKFWEK